MKKIILVFTGLLLSTFTILSQDSIKKHSIGVDFNIGNNALGRKNIYPSIVLSKGKHSFFIGPSFIYGSQYRLYAPIHGLQAGYLFYPNGHQKRFNLFFEYDFNYTKVNVDFKYYLSSQNGLKKRSIELMSIDNYIGFGFRTNIFKGLYIKTNASVGMIFYSENVEDEFYNGTVSKSNMNPRFYVGNYYPYRYGGSGYPYYFNRKYFIGLFKIGIGYDIHIKKSKK